MGMRLTWTSRSGLRLGWSTRAGRVRLWESVPLTRSRTGRRRRVRKGVSVRL
jgi:hypothetical protein